MSKKDGAVAAPNKVVVDVNSVSNTAPPLFADIVHDVILFPRTDRAFNDTFQILTGVGHWIINQPVGFVVDHELSAFRLLNAPYA